ncbi:MAG TPA: transcriptional regulator [Lachnospiraceae bacterium]|nr:transcriptional regulator [Lachnospiraceae bacterium]
MNKEDIGKVLKLYRKKNNYKVSDVAIKLSEDGKFVAEKTVYGWESAQALPDAECLIKLCELYNIRDLKAAFLGGKSRLIEPTRHEEELLHSYRIHSEMQPAVDKLLDINNNKKSNYH